MNSPIDAAVQCALAEAQNRGLDLEVYVGGSRATRIAIQDGEVETFALTDSRGLGVRVFDAGRVGYSYTESLTDDAIRRVVAEAIENARLLEPDDAAGLGELAGPVPVIDLYDPSIAEVPVERKIALALDLYKAAREGDSRVKTVVGNNYGDSEGFLRVANTRGLDRSYRSSAAWASCMPLVTQDGLNKSLSVVKAVRTFGDLEPLAMAREAVGKSLALLGASELDSGHYPVLLTPEAFSDLLETFSGLFSAKVAQEGKSLLRGKEGTRIASGVFTLKDDPLLAGGFSSRPFDDEGCPSQAMELITSGTFNGFLHNVETARRAGTATTGHASRGGYAGVLHVSPSNLVVQPGNEDVVTLLARHPDTLQIVEIAGLHAGANTISGDFSLQAQGFLHKGNDAVPKHLFTVSGNFLDLLAAIEAVGSDVEHFPSGTATPSVLVSSLSIAGR